MATNTVSNPEEMESQADADIELITGETPAQRETGLETMDIFDKSAKHAHSRRKEKQPVDFRRIPVPSNRFTPLKHNWMKIFTPCVQHMKLHIRINLRNRCVELRTSQDTSEPGAIQKAADFVKAFLLGFEVDDAIALLRLDELFVESFEVLDVKPLKGDHLSRAIGRIAGRGGKTKFTIENITKTRVVLADSKIHILGAYQNIRVARTAICNLILGSPPSKVYGSLKIIASRFQAQL